MNEQRWCLKVDTNSGVYTIELHDRCRYQITTVPSDELVLRVWDSDWTRVIPFNRVVELCLPNQGPMNE